MGKISIAMVGDSLVDFGNWNALLPAYNILSRGIPGEYAEDLLFRLRISRDLDGVDAILVMTGTNNIFTGEFDCTPTIEKIACHLMSTYPGTTVFLNSLVPFRLASFNDVVTKTNTLLRQIAHKHGASYIDLHTVFEQEGGEHSLFEFDGVHFSTAGYLVWARVLSDTFGRLLAKESD